MDDPAEDLDPALGAAWRSSVPEEFLTTVLESGERMGGHAGEARAAELVADALADASADGVDTSAFDLQRWIRGTAELAVTAPVERSFECFALPYCPPADVSGDLVDVGYGTAPEIDERDVAGAIAVASTTTPPGERFVHRMEKFGHAVAAGAEGFVFANHELGQLPPTGSLRFDAEAAVPGVGVSHETGEWLREYADRDGRARIAVDAATDPGTSRNVVGTLGPATDDEVLVLAHYDAHDVGEGALDNGCGVAVLVATVRILSRLALDFRVRVAAVGCEEVGLLGSRALARRLDPDGLRAVVNVDGAGRFRDLRALTHAADEIPDVVERVADRVGHPIHVDEDPHPYSDHWPFLRRGVPALQLHSQPPGGGDRGRGWTHTAADTRDKVDPRNLRTHGMLCALLVRELARADVPRVDGDTLREALRAEGFEQGMRAAGVWPDDWDA